MRAGEGFQRHFKGTAAGFQLLEPVFQAQRGAPLAVARERGTEQNLAPFVLTGPGIPRQGNAVVSAGEEVGVVTSGTLSPSLEVGIGMAYVPVELAEPGTAVSVDAFEPNLEPA